MVKVKRDLWRRTAAILMGLGVHDILPEVRDLTLLWASTRKVTAAQLACKYLLELEAGFRETYLKEPLA